MDYRQMINIHALRALPHVAIIPDFRLGIGEAERMDSIPVLLFTDFSAPPQKVKNIDISKEPIEKFGFTGDGNYISSSDFESDEFFENINLKEG